MSSYKYIKMDKGDENIQSPVILGQKFITLQKKTVSILGFYTRIYNTKRNPINCLSLKLSP